MICSDCPWNTKKHKRWISWVNKTPTVKNKIHKCHLKDKDTWGYKTKITNENVCEGRKLYLKNE